MILPFWQNDVQARALKLCTHMGFEPYVIQKGQSLSGIDIDIMVAVLKSAKQPADIKAYSWPGLLKALEEGTCDAGFSLFDTEDRRAFVEYIFTVPIHYSTFSIFVKKGREFTFNRVSDFFGMKIAHNRGFALTVGLEQAISDGYITRFSFDDVKEALDMLEKGKIDAVLDNDARFRYYLKKRKKFGSIRSLSVPFLPHQPAFLVMSRRSTLSDIDAIKEMFEKRLKKLHLDGTIMNITTQYLN
ncbi:transporter substrate-binding domain-containing protein [Terasakiella sp. A23]|uniref:substrate-binding periplasmic protein n=1 Tax=Terasakiella sp. FCG-A23 TaxID=3080561 RepID=UPI0029549F3F|nr:transporter substrate-binding domain-containing protein [Terasakiella sp. A23]MDV7341125.1 transporter substrate-binding domain-containing protein [Terasakiella sp. A23]